MKSITKTKKELVQELENLTKVNEDLKASLKKVNEELVQEIDEHRKTKHSLLNSNQKIEAIINSIPEGIGMLTLDGKLLYISDKLAEINGDYAGNIDGLLGKSVLDFVDLSSHNLLIENMNKLITGKKDDKRTEYLAIKKDKTRFYIEVNSTVLHDSEGKPDSVIFVERDITERKKYEEALMQSNQKLEAIISATPDGIGMISIDGKIQEIMSDKLPKMYGYTKEEKDEFVGKSVLDFIDPSSHKLLKDNIKKLYAGEEIDKLTEYLAIKKDNSRFYIEVNSTVLFDANGEPSGILFVERDITARKKAETTIRQQYDQLNMFNKTKDKFFSIIAHDLRSPFQSLLGSSEILANEIDKLTHGEIVFYSGKIFNSLKNLYNLLENLLTWSMLQRNIMEYNPVSLNLYEFVENIIQVLNQIAVKKNILLLNKVSNEIFVYADADMLRSIIHNLLTNAIKFTPPEGSIFISSIENNNFIEVSVLDTGIGISKDKSDMLFNVSSIFSTKGTAGEIGTGLGLTLCKEFIERNKGKIWVESELNKGSKFIFTIPKAVK